MKTIARVWFLYLLAFSLGITALLVPCWAASADVKVPLQGSIMNPGLVATDGQLIATYINTDTPPVVHIYTLDGKPYASLPLTNSTSGISCLAISGSRVYYTESDSAIVWTDRRETVYEYNLDTRQKRALYSTQSFSDLLAKNADQILKNGGQVDQERVTMIAASGDHVVLRGGSNDRELILHTLSTGSNNVIFTSRDWIHGLAIDGDRIMWGCERVDKEPGREIHVYTISAGKDSIIPESKSAKTYGYGDISGDNVVWAMSAKDPHPVNGVPVTSAESYDMKLTNVVSGKTQSVEQSDTAPITVPFISGDTVAWVKMPKVDYNTSDTGTIRLYNIKTGTFSDLATHVSGISDFANGVVLWSRMEPVSFWVTPVSGKIPDVTSTIPAQTTNQVSTTIPQSTTSRKSPVDPGLAVAVLAAGSIGYALLHRKH